MENQFEYQIIIERCQAFEQLHQLPHHLFSAATLLMKWMYTQKSILPF